ncbi:MAG: SusC/RagA family TonB-linked outer membrane protein, partial [Alistipes sp.]|nr:SusC/RagA family TonB-linked outer membrane protein [Alistipes sp.]
MVRKLVLSFIAAVGVFALASAQQRQVSGTVTGADGSPIVGASVFVEGTSTGTTTDVAGGFALTAPADGTLTVSFIGYQTKSVAIAGKTKFAISLDEDTQAIDDVIVVAFGTTTKEAFTGSASVIKSDDIAKRQVSNVAQALAGAAAGVQVNSASGNPTSTPKIHIRGLSSISAGTDPLYVIDGVPYAGDLNLINTADIETMTILKDAASTALYGSRGANGVIMITTKRAKVGEAVVNFDAKWGVNTRATRLYDYINNPGEYYETHYKALYNYYLDNGLAANAAHIRANQNLTGSDNGGLGYNVYTVPAGQYLIGSNGRLNPAATLGRMVNYNGQDYWLQPDDWEDAAYKSSLRQEYNVNIAASNERANFYASLGYLENNGIVDNSNFSRYTGRLRADYQAKKWLKVGANVSYSHYESSSLSNESDGASTVNV